MLSFCTGAFVFAEAGLLGGLEVTTHHECSVLLERRFPRVRVDLDVLFSTRRAGHQAQRVVAGPGRLVGGGPMPMLLDWLTEQLHERIEVADMARRVAMSERTCARRFEEVTATTPIRWRTMTGGACRCDDCERSPSRRIAIEVLASRSPTGRSSHTRWTRARLRQGETMLWSAAPSDIPSERSGRTTVSHSVATMG